MSASQATVSTITLHHPTLAQEMYLASLVARMERGQELSRLDTRRMGPPRPVPVEEQIELPLG